MEASDVITTPHKEEPLSNLIASLRDASRKLVREWGFLRSVFAESPLSPAAVHCLIEIGDAPDTQSCTSSRLSTELRVLPRELARILSELIASGCITVENARLSSIAGDVAYALTPKGAQTLHAINAYAEGQVSRALAAVPAGTASDITAAFRLYTAALERARAAPTPESSRPASPTQLPIPPPVLTPSLPIPTSPPRQTSTRNVTIAPGYTPTLISSAVQMHMSYYHTRIGWDREFETGLSSMLADIVSRLDNPRNQAWAAIETLPPSTLGQTPTQKIIGTIFIDGEVPGRENCAQLRAFIVDESARGLGLGRKLVGAAMGFVREMEFEECRLTTMRDLAAARRLYEGVGFVEVREERKVIWGVEVGEMEYLWRRV
ncbi:acyl-CoA N-acyltransferase [Podospora aff. communis PSN243]|uniref:Acyl-CoA N-acyltransferase n=1 Tax=Podospora aff. communis PSN243 TaxID=3040156 RepID=A0AAV9GX76_9PEZI|nr:acyl-CoA N-acyltransferase [Podospora aff. communis PSN243]